MSTCIYVTTVKNVQYCVQLAFFYDYVPDFIIVDTFFHYSNQFKVQDNKGIWSQIWRPCHVQQIESLQIVCFVYNNRS